MTLAKQAEGLTVVHHPPTRVLVADDATGIRELLCLLIEMEDDFVVVGQARNGVEALDLTEREHPDLVLLDLAMPVLDGLEALPRLRALVPDATIVVFSGYEPAALADQAVESGADGYVEKNAAVTRIVEQLRVLRAARDKGGPVRSS